MPGQRGIAHRITVLMVASAVMAVVMTGLAVSITLTEYQGLAEEENKAEIVAQAQAQLEEDVHNRALYYDALLRGVENQLETIALISSAPYQSSEDPGRDLNWTWFIPPLGANDTVNASRSGEINRSLQVVPALMAAVGSNPIIETAYFHAADGDISVFHDPGVVPFVEERARQDGEFVAKERPWYVAAAPVNQTIWTEPYIDAITGQLTTTAARRVVAANTVVGVVGLDLLLDTIQTNLLSNATIDHFAFLLDHNGNLLVPPPADILNWSEEVKETDLARSDNPDLFALGSAALTGEERVLAIELGSRRYFVALAGISTTGWTVSVVASEDKVLEVYDSLQQRQQALFGDTLLLIALTILVVALLAWMFSGTFANLVLAPLYRLTDEAKKFSTGEPVAELPVERTDEIGLLTMSFNRWVRSEKFGTADSFPIEESGQDD